jgi:excisionase family DNA binding protein
VPDPLDELLSSTPPERLPSLIVRLAACMATAGARLSGPSASAPAVPVVNVDVEEAARRLGVSERYVYRHASRLPFVVREGRRLLANGAALERYIQKRTGA